MPKNELTNISNKLTALSDSINNLGSTKTVNLANKSSSNGVALDLNGVYVVTTSTINDKIRLRLYQNGGYTETWKNLQIQYKKIS